MSGVHNVVVEVAAIVAEEGTINLFIGENSGWHSLVASDQNLRKKSIAVDVFNWITI